MNTDQSVGATFTPVPVGKQWGKPVPIQKADNLRNAEGSQVVVDSAGNAIVVWYQSNGNGNDIWANRFDGVNRKWGVPERIDRDNPGDAADPQVAVDSAGNAVAVWSQYDNKGQWSDIWVNRFDGVKWGGPVRIEKRSGNAEGPQVAVDSSGNAIAVWSQYDKGDQWKDIWANRFDGVNFNLELIATQLGTDEDPRPQVAVDKSGNAIVVWSQLDDTLQKLNILANRFDGVKWGDHPELIETGLGNAEGPQVAVDKLGNAVVVWKQLDDKLKKQNVWANRFNGVKWGVATLIETDNTGHAHSPHVAVDKSGNAIVVWAQFDGTRDNILASRFDSATLKWGGATSIGMDTGNAAMPRVAVDPSGNAIAVWRQSDGIDGTLYNIWANRFE